MCNFDVFRNYLTSNSLKVLPLNHFEPIEYTPLYKSLNTFAKEKGNFTSMIFILKAVFCQNCKNPDKIGVFVGYIFFYSRFLAEAVGFEPTSPWRLPDFEWGTKDRNWRKLTEDKAP